MRRASKGVLDPVAGFLLKIGLTPNAVTILGLVITVGGAVLAGMGKFTLAVVVLLIGAPLDAVDGAMARKLGSPTRFGGFLDSVLDRYAELSMMGGLLFYYMNQGNSLDGLLIFIAAAGSVMVSYTRARAEGLGFNGKGGLLGRIERMILMILFLLIRRPMIAILIIAVLANFTAIQRVLLVHKQAVDTK